MADADPRTVDTLSDLAALLRRLHLDAGKPSLRELEKRDLGVRPDGRRYAALSRSSVSAVLNGDRLPTPDTLLSLLVALGVPARDHQPWLTARGRLTGDRRRPVRPWVIAAVVALATVVAVAVVLLIAGRSGPATIGCAPADCRATAPALTVTGRLGEPVPAGSRAYVLIQVQSTQRWYLGPAIRAGEDLSWTQQIGLGNPVPQAKDRHFLVCVHLLPTGGVDRAVQAQMARRGAGLTEAELPPGRTELACTPAVRAAHS